MNNQTLLFSTMIILGFAALIIWAATGSIMAIITLSIVATITIFVSGALVAVYVVKIMQSKQQQDFMDNAQENLSIMNSLQRVQNQQNSQLLKQVKQLPPTNGYNPIFDVEPGIFDEL